MRRGFIGRRPTPTRADSHAARRLEFWHGITEGRTAPLLSV